MGGRRSPGDLIAGLSLPDALPHVWPPQGEPARVAFQQRAGGVATRRLDWVAHLAPANADPVLSVWVGDADGLVRRIAFFIERDDGGPTDRVHYEVRPTMGQPIDMAEFRLPATR